MIDDLNNVDFLSSNVSSSRKEALLCIFEDNEAVIKMIIKGTSPTMRHVTRTHRVALDWLFDRINFDPKIDPKIQISYVDTKNQLADILTKCGFSKDEWNNLLRLLNIMTVSTFSRSQFNHFVSDVSRNPKTMSKRGQEQNFGEGSAVAKPKPISLVQAMPRVVGVSSVSRFESLVCRKWL